MKKDDVMLAFNLVIGVLVILALFAPWVFTSYNQYGRDYYPQSFNPSQFRMGTSDNQALISLYGGNFTYAILTCTHSMQPAMGCGNTVIEQALTPNDTVNIGDIVSFNNGMDVIHQVISIDGDCYLTKGINNINADGCVNRSEIKYRAIGVFYSGAK